MGGWVGGWVYLVGHLGGGVFKGGYVLQLLASCTHSLGEGGLDVGNVEGDTSGWVGGWVGHRKVVCFFSFRMRCWKLWVGGWVGG